MTAGVGRGDRVFVAFPIAVDADPVHCAAALDLFLADHGDVVLGLTSGDACAAADARRQIDVEAPRIALVFETRVEPLRLLRRLAHLGGKLRIFFERRERAGANQRAALHVVRVLRGDEREFAAFLGEGYRRAVKPRQGAQGIDVDARAVADAPDAPAPVAEVKNDDVVGQTGRQKTGASTLLPLLATLTTAPPSLSSSCESPSCSPRDQETRTALSQVSLVRASAALAATRCCEAAVVMSGPGAGPR